MDNFVHWTCVAVQLCSGHTRRSQTGAASNMGRRGPSHWRSRQPTERSVSNV